MYQIVFLIFLFKEVAQLSMAATPMVIPPKQKIYEYRMNLEWKLTMMHFEENNTGVVLGWDPNHKDYFVRLSDQHLQCDATGPLDRKTNLDDVMFMDGQHQRIISVNGQSPGFPIIVYNGSEVVVHLENNLLLEGITVHFHGQDKRYQWFMDGVALVQQCPIPARSTFTYRFIADTPGTHWYHGHIATDRGQGLAGPFIVLPENEDRSVTLGDGTKIVPDEEYILVVQDWPVPKADDTWYHHIWETMKFLYRYDNWDECWTPTRTYDGTNVGGSVPISALLINDKGWHNQSDIKNQPWNLNLEKFSIKPGQKVLFRMINVGRSFPIMLSIENHKLHVVSTDGVPIVETVSDMIVSFPGERFDFLIFADEHPKRHQFYMIAESLEYYDYFWQKMEPNYGLGLLEYESSSSQATQKRTADLSHQNCHEKSRCIVVNCPWPKFPNGFPYDCMTIGDLKSLEHFQTDALRPAYEENFQEVFLNMHYDSHINGWRFMYPKAPPYFHNDNMTTVAIPCTNESCTAEGCWCFNHLSLTLGNVIQLTVYNMGQGSGLTKGYAHPLHIHGLHYYVIKQEFGGYNETTGIISNNSPDIPCNYSVQCNNQSWTNPTWLKGRVPGANLINPPFKDTVTVPAGGYVVLRFKADNPGWWFAHCHIILHHLGGMAFALKIGDHEQIPKPPKSFPQGCGSYDPGHPYSDPSSFTTVTPQPEPQPIKNSTWPRIKGDIVEMSYGWFVGMIIMLLVTALVSFLSLLIVMCMTLRGKQQKRKTTKTYQRFS